MSRRLRFTNANHCTEERLGENPNAFGFSCSKDPISDQPECVVSTSTEPEYSYSMTGCQQCANECTYAERDYDDNNSENSENSDEDTKKDSDMTTIYVVSIVGISVVVLTIVFILIYKYVYPKKDIF